MEVWIRALAATAVAVGLLALPAALVQRQAASHQRDLLRREGAHLVDLEREFLTREMQAVRGDLEHLAQQPGVARALDGEAGALRALEREYEVFARAKPRYDQVRLLDRTGLELVRINRRGAALELVEVSRLQAKADRYYFREGIGLPLGSLYVSPLDLNVEHGAIERPPKPVIRLAAPVSGSSGLARGLLVFNYAGSRLLAELRRIAAASPGKTLLVNSEGEYLLAPEPGREWGWLLGHRASFRDDHPEAWAGLRDTARAQLWVEGELFSGEWVALGEGAAVGPSAVAIVSHLPTRPLLAPGARAAALALGLGALAILSVLAYTWARAAVARRAQEQQIVASEARLRLLSSQLLAAQENERRSLSRLLHDELGQTVTAIALDLRNALRRTPDGPGAETLLRVIAESEGVLARLHEIGTRIRPSVLDDLGLAEALESFVSEFEERTGIAVELVLGLARREPAGPVAENLYRIVQEALSNVASHAETDAARVVLRSDPGGLELRVEDRGRGFDPATLKTPRRLGILGMRERVELLAGEFELDTAPGGGTRLRVRLPWATG